MAVLNDLDRFHLVGDVIDRVPRLRRKAAYVKQAIRDKLIEHKQYIARHGEDMPEMRDWQWGQPGFSSAQRASNGSRQYLTSSSQGWKSCRFSPRFRPEFGVTPGVWRSGNRRRAM